MVLPLAHFVNDTPILGPIGIGIGALGTVSQQVIGSDAVRHGLIFHNPGDQNIRIMPANVTPIAGAGGIVLYPQTEQEIFGDENSYLNINCAWNAVADSGSNNPLTILNFTDNNQSVPAPNALAQLDFGVPIVSPNGIQVANVGVGSMSIIGPNPVRRAITFHNPGAITLYVCPANLGASTGAGSVTLLPGQSKTIRARGRIRVNCGWNACSESLNNNTLTILEYL